MNRGNDASPVKEIVMKTKKERIDPVDIVEVSGAAVTVTGIVASIKETMIQLPEDPDPRSTQDVLLALDEAHAAAESMLAANAG